MTTPTHEHTINVALGEMLGRLRQSWTTRSEQTGQVLIGGGRPDILIEEASGWPVVIEAERTNRTSAENDAKARLGRTVAGSGRQIETAIALVYPEDLPDERTGLCPLPRIHRWTRTEGGYKRDGPGSNSGRRGVGGGLQAFLGATMSAYSGCCERHGGIRRQECSTELVRRGRSVGRMAGQWRSCAVRRGEAALGKRGRH